MTLVLQQTTANELLHKPVRRDCHCTLLVLEAYPKMTNAPIARNGIWIFRFNGVPRLAGPTDRSVASALGRPFPPVVSAKHRQTVKCRFYLDHGESILDAVRREVLEETAYVFTPRHLLGIYLAPGPGDITYLRFAFTGELGEHDASRTLDEGIVGTVWLTPDEVRAQRARHRSPLLERCVDDYLRGVRYDLAILQTHPGVTGGQGNT
jgi:hypothetical protein